MELQLQELIEQIKKDGVDAAALEAAAIIEAANAEAKKIVAEAQTQADKLIAAAKAENDRITAAGNDALRQAGRNLLISFRESVSRELRAIVGEQVSAAYSSEAFAQLIVRVIEGWAAKPDAEDLAVILSNEDLRALEDTVLAALKEKAISGVTLRASDSLDSGFRIATADGTAYYDYSAEAVTDMLSQYLSPRVTALLKEAQ